MYPKSEEREEGREEENALLAAELRVLAAGGEVMLEGGSRRGRGEVESDRLPPLCLFHAANDNSLLSVFKICKYQHYK